MTFTTAFSYQLHKKSRLYGLVCYFADISKFVQSHYRYIKRDDISATRRWIYIVLSLICTAL